MQYCLHSALRLAMLFVNTQSHFIPLRSCLAIIMILQDNILMELVSETVVSVAPRELFWHKSQNEEVSGKYFKVRLQPGQGIVIPSNYLHSVRLGRRRGLRAAVIC